MRGGIGDSEISSEYIKYPTLCWLIVDRLKLVTGFTDDL